MASGDCFEFNVRTYVGKLFDNTVLNLYVQYLGFVYFNLVFHLFFIILLILCLMYDFHNK